MAKVLGKTTYPEDKWLVTGEAESGKTTFAIALAKETADKGQKIYLWNTDGREQEYARALPEGKVLVPDTDDLFDTAAVLKAIEKDIAAGEFRDVGQMIMDNSTHIYQTETRKALQDKMDGGKSTYNKKANAMALLRAAVMRPRCNFIIFMHRYDAGDLKGQMVERDTLSDTEKDRLELAINVKLRTIRQNGKYGIEVLMCRQRPGLKPFTIWDEPGNFFQGMPQKIRAALYDNGAVPVDEPKAWKSFDEKHPFPNPDVAIQLGAEFFVEASGQKFYPFGDPHTEVIKADGTPGTNGVLIHARGSYEKLKRGEYEGFRKPGTAGEMASFWKALVERKCHEQVQEFSKKKPELEVKPEPQVDMFTEPEEASPELELQEETF